MKALWTSKKSFLDSKAWKITRKQILHDALYTCEECYERAEEVHHKEPLTDDNVNDWNISLNPKNLQALCTSCHSKKTNGYTGDVTEGYIFSEDGQVIKI